MVATTETNVGKIVQIIGPVIDAEFPSGNLPRIYNALTVKGTNSAGQNLSVDKVTYFSYLATEMSSFKKL